MIDFNINNYLRISLTDVVLVCISTFLIVMFAKKFFWEKLLTLIQKRQDLIQENIDSSVAIKKQAEDVKEQYDEKLRNVSQEAHTILVSARAHADQEKQQIIKEAAERTGAKKVFIVEDISYKELLMALKNENGRKIVCNYGLDPKLGKYHRTFCEECGKSIEGKAPIFKCNRCGSEHVTMGVFDRIEVIKDKKETKSPKFRPPYVYQIPLTFMPGLGKKTIEKLLDNFETEMNI